MADILYWLQIVLLLLGILVSCEIFTNAIENLGEKLNIGHEFTGSVLAAVGTALPETILPLVAIYMASQAGAEAVSTKHDIAIGAILGAPFLLTTLAMFLLGLSIFLHRKSRGTDLLKVNPVHLERDLKYFLKVFLIAILATSLSSDYLTRIIEQVCSTELGLKIMHIFHPGIMNQCFDDASFILRLIVGLVIILLYINYLMVTYQASQEEFSGDYAIVDCPILYMERYLKLKVNMFTVVLQTLIGLGGIIFFAHGFVEGVEHISEMIAVSPLVLSLIVSPIATELPEKVNSWIWSSQGKDVLAMGNLSGAMVFQASIPCVIGIVMTPWVLSPIAIICASLAIVSTLVLYISLKLKSQLNYQVLLSCGGFYLIYLALVFLS
ncbi:MAG: hypothetical protein OXU45_07385 [Candidatus Melainabacteria bacterium]|nr:hypothetical protein [Candidatus Melainabacteria bacterium]